MSDQPNSGSDDALEGSAPGAADPQADREQVLFEIAFFEPVLLRSPAFVEILQLLGSHYTRVGRYEEGLLIDRRLVRLCPDDAVAHYNLACSLSLTHKPAAAVRELDRALALGYRDLAHIDSDPDLDNLRSHPAFLTLLRRLRQE